MQSPKKPLPTKLLWVDLEMTGLDDEHDVILEIAAEVTDFDFKKIASYQARVSHHKELVTERMSHWPWWQDYPENQRNFLEKLGEGKASALVEQELLALVAEHFGDEPAILAGNSIHSDRRFIKSWWPALYARLHYRMLDVTALKVYMQGRYGLEYEKKDVHRAFDDIQASIAEWQYYMDWLKEHDQA